MPANGDALPGADAPAASGAEASAASGADAPAASGADAPAASGADAPAASGADAPAVGPEGVQGGAQGWHQADISQLGGDATTPPHDSEAATAAGDEVSSWDFQTNSNLPLSAIRDDEDKTEQVSDSGQEHRRKSTPGLIFTNEYGEEIEDSTEDRGDKWSKSPDGSGSEYETAEEWGDGGQGGGWASADDELLYENHPPVNTSDGWGGGDDGVERVLRECDEADRQCPAENELFCKQSHLISVDRIHSESAKKDVIRVCESEMQGGGAFDSDPFAETQGGGAFDSDPFAETQGGGAFDSDPFTERHGGGAFDSDPFAETHGGGAFDSDPFAETNGGGAFDSDPFPETQGQGAFHSVLSAETQRGGGFDSVLSAETHGGGSIDSDYFAETQGGGAFDVDPFAEMQRGGVFDSDPFAEMPGGGAFDSDPFAETQGGGAFDSAVSAERQGGGVFVSVVSAERQGEGVFDTDSLAEKQEGGGFDSDPFAETQEAQFGNKGDGFEFDSFAETSGDSGAVATGDGRSGWDTDTFTNSFPADFSMTEGLSSNITTWQEVSDNSGFSSSIIQKSASASAAGGIKDVNLPRMHKEPENSDMSEDEAANRRFGKLYQELDTEKEEVLDFLPSSVW